VDVVFGPEVFGQRYGGISRYFIELQRRLPGLGVHSTVLAGLHRNEDLSEVSGVRGLRVPTRVQKARLRPLEERVNGVLAAGRLRLGRPVPLYHQTYYDGLIAGSHRGPVVVTAYDLIHAKLAEYFPPDDPTVGQQRAAFARADLVLAISQCTADDLQEVLGVPAGKIAVTHLGVSTPPARAVTTTGRSKPFLLYVGLRYGYKNWENFVRAVAACPAVDELDLLCVGAGSFTPAETALLAELALTSRVHQVNADNDLLDACYREAVAFGYPSRYEGFGLPPLEAMARGCPVVASRAGSIPEVLGDAAVLADPADIDALAEAIAEVVRPGRREQLVEAGYERALIFPWDSTASATVAAYTTLVG
jgi:glycosyltransferase involved in cell wall biosynthesis